MSWQKKLQKKVNKRAKRRACRVKKSQVSRGVKPRVSVFRSLKHIYAQVIDDATQKTIVGFSSLQLENLAGDKKAVAKKVGEHLGKLATEKNVIDVFFDRGKFLYHGRVSALADGLREAGLKF